MEDATNVYCTPGLPKALALGLGAAAVTKMKKPGQTDRWTVTVIA